MDDSIAFLIMSLKYGNFMMIKLCFIDSLNSCNSRKATLNLFILRVDFLKGTSSFQGGLRDLRKMADLLKLDYKHIYVSFRHNMNLGCFKNVIRIYSISVMTHRCCICGCASKIKIGIVTEGF